MPVERPRSSFATTLLLLGLDASCLVFGVLGAYWIRFESQWIPILRPVPPLTWYTLPLGLVLVIFVLCLHAVGLYDLSQPWQPATVVGKIWNATTRAIVGVMALTFLSRELSYSRLTLAIAWILITVLLIGTRLAWLRWTQWWRWHRRKEAYRVLVVGCGDEAVRLIRQIQAHPHLGYTLAGCVATHNPHPTQVEGIPVLGTLDRLESLLRSHGILEVILADSSVSHKERAGLALQCEKELVCFRMMVDVLGLVTTPLALEELAGMPILGMKPVPLDDPWNRFLKRSMDLVLSLLGVILLFPLWVLIALAIRLDSPGPIFYRQERLGQDGRVFRIWKFRTMAVGAERDIGPVWAKPNDPRCTRIGRWLRRFNLDELPQLINVLKGEMSLVGPRPERPHFVDQFKEEIPRYMARHRIKAGMTGWAQIHGLRGNTPIEERLRYDLYYIEHWSLGLDLKILIQSLWAWKNAY